jgi:hypothetical protein
MSVISAWNGRCRWAGVDGDRGVPLRGGILDRRTPVARRNECTRKFVGRSRSAPRGSTGMRPALASWRGRDLQWCTGDLSGQRWSFSRFPRSRCRAAWRRPAVVVAAGMLRPARRRPTRRSSTSPSSAGRATTSSSTVCRPVRNSRSRRSSRPTASRSISRSWPPTTRVPSSTGFAPSSLRASTG